MRPFDAFGQGRQPGFDRQKGKQHDAQRLSKYQAADNTDAYGVGCHFCKINAVKLKQFFGLVLVFPLVKMMKLGQIWLDPMAQDYILATIGDLIIWLIIVVPIGIVKFLFGGRRPIVVDTDSDGTGEIYLFVGGSVDATSAAQGNYSGTFTMTVSYD